MLNILVSASVKPGREDEFREFAASLAKVTNEEDEGCITYQFLQEIDDPREFVIYEQWRDQPSLDAHIVHLRAMFGEPEPGARLPAALGEFFEKMTSTKYEAID